MSTWKTKMGMDPSMTTEHFQAYHNTDPKRVFKSNTCLIVYSKDGYTIGLYGKPSKTFTGVWVNEDLTMYIVNGLIHRTDGPAKIFAANENRTTVFEYYVNDIFLHIDQFKELYLVIHLKEYQGEN